jgi:hypothetical protein
MKILEKCMNSKTHIKFSELNVGDRFTIDGSHDVYTYTELDPHQFEKVSYILKIGLAIRPDGAICRFTDHPKECYVDLVVARGKDTALVQIESPSELQRLEDWEH